ncbi:MAG: AMP-binding domain protein [Frankiales bacterium]|nr:AMP-binding domain protein [Frankiales bacterium]
MDRTSALTTSPPDDLLWPEHGEPGDLPRVEAVPLEERGLPDSTYAIFRRAAALWPDRVALTVLPTAERFDDGVPTTYAELLRQLHRTAHALAGAGVRRGTAVGLLSPNTHELLVATVAAQAVAVAAPVNPALGPVHVADLLRRSAVRVLVACGPELDAEVWQTARDVAAQLGLTTLLALRPVTAAGDGPRLEAVPGTEVRYLQEAVAGLPDGELPVTAPGPGELAACFHTGGTTGAPRLAAHTHRNQVVNAWSLAINSALEETSVLFAALPLFHVNALVVTVLAPALRGQSVVWAAPTGYRSPALLASFWRLVEHHGVTTMSGVPTVYAALSQVPVDADITSLRFAIVGASPLPASVRESFSARTGVPLLQGYGLTEATCASARNFPGHDRGAAVGQRMPYQQVAVFASGDVGGQPLATGQVGVLAVKGPTVFPGYVVNWGDTGPQLDSSGKVIDGWLDTGDLARVDDEAYVHLVGREKDLIIRGGHNIDPVVVEDALLAHPAVTGALAVGRPDRHAGEVPVAYVTVAAGADVDEEQLRTWAAAHVPEPAAAPREVLVWPVLPVTAVGKPYKVALRLDAAEREVRGALAAAEIEGEVQAMALRQGLRVLVSTSAAQAQVAASLDGYDLEWCVQPAGAALPGALLGREHEAPL